MAQGDAAAKEVTWEDQQNINTFGRLDKRFKELVQEIKVKKDMAECLEDAGSELVLSDDFELVRFQVGDVFGHFNKEYVESKIESLKEEADKKLEELQDEKEQVLAKMTELKRILYGKFKDNIRLEED